MSPKPSGSGKSTTQSLLLLSLSCWVYCQAVGQTSQPIPSHQGGASVERALNPGERIKIELGGGQSHRYQVNLKAGEFLHVEVIQSEIDVVVSIVRPDGSLLVSMDSLDRLWREEVSTVAETSGGYKVEVKAREKESLPGSYTIRIDELRAPTAGDLRRITAEQLFIEGLTFWTQGNRDGMTKAQKKYEEALKMWVELGDKQWQAMTLSNLGYVHLRLDAFSKSLSLLKSAIALYKQTGDRMGEGRSLRAMGVAYSRSGDEEKNKESLELALQNFRELRARKDEAVILINLASYYYEKGKSEKAIDYYTQSLRLSLDTKSRRNESFSLQGLGLAYNGVGEYEKAIDCYQKALAISRDLKDRYTEQSVLNNLGGLYIGLNFRKALDYLELALPIVRELGFRYDEGFVLNNIGYSYLNLNQYEKSREALELALQAERDSKNHGFEVLTLSNLASLNFRLGHFNKAEEYYQLALDVSREHRNRSGEGIALTQLGIVYVVTGKHHKASEYYNRALFIRREIKDLAGEGETLSKMMLLWQQLAIPRLAILYGKQAVNVYQGIRKNIRGLDQETRKTYLASIASTYRTLADLLVAAGRLPEAEQVLRLLKEEEYFEFVRRDGNALKGLLGSIDLTPDEQQAVRRYLEIADTVTSLGSRIETLSKQKPRTPKEQTRIDQDIAGLRKDMEAANITFNAVLREIEAEFSKSTRKGESVLTLQANRGLRADLREWGPNTVVLSTIAGENTYRVILTTATVQIAGASEIKQEELNKLVLDFRQAVQDPCACIDPRPLGQKLYQILLGPVEKQLQELQKQAGQRPLTVVWSLDGTLRYLPVAALWDGKRYLVERYRNVVITLASRTRIAAVPRREWRGLGLGVSEAREVLDPVSNQNIRFNALPAVPEELHHVIREGRGAGQGVVPGHILLNSKFTQPAMTNELREGGFSLVHIASHFVFKPGDERQSFLLLGDGNRITLQQFRNAAELQFAGVELLTLSACDTAMGGTSADGKEIEGFAMLAQEQGAKAVLATLWPVADTSTQLLMTELYRQRQTNRLEKVEALRQAQLGLLNGRVKAGKVSRTRTGELVKETSKRTFPLDSQKPYAHPYYWAPFILIGNWR